MSLFVFNADVIIFRALHGLLLNLGDIKFLEPM